MKDLLINGYPDTPFIHFANKYYAIMSKISEKEKIKIKKVGYLYLITKGRLSLFSSIPKFLGFGLKVFEGKFEKFFKIEKGETVADIGACIGDTTLPMCIKAGMEGKVFAVEPHPINIGYLKLNLAEFSNVEIIEKAVWDKKGKIMLNVHDTPTGHSLLDRGITKWKIQVETDTLDNIFKDRIVDFAK
ncbi:MAG: FkbM family methyltransferase [Candidatus Methanomethyliaceae archaeon]|nr:FkbM family methyltransferase [Candidatus Methanomethyliaceae archaeon]